MGGGGRLEARHHFKKPEKNPNLTSGSPILSYGDSKGPTIRTTEHPPKRVDKRVTKSHPGPRESRTVPKKFHLGRARGDEKRRDRKNESFFLHQPHEGNSSGLEK